MIYGIGTDIVQISRIERALISTRGRFAEKILGPDELLAFQQRLALSERRGWCFLASRFAAKEAFSKAIRLGMRAPMEWKSVQVLNADSGQPHVIANGELLEWMQYSGLTSHVTISDERDYAVAFVVVEKTSE
ncbi:holo-ACP synthase [Undibacterium sp. SXout7W]|uniref:holo-ACP synthase n=1 Tax=Undibacterium sp. SXout7W TaxID=3413049 RepID=UPI003BF08CBE